MIFDNPSPDKQLQDRLIPGVLFVVAQAARNKSTVSFAQIDDAVVSAMVPADAQERGRMRRALFDIFAKKVLIRQGVASFSKARTEGGPQIMNLTQRGMALLGRRCADMLPVPDLKQDLSVSTEAPRVTEKDLVIPALATLVKMHEETGLPVNMTDLREGIKRMLTISSKDLDPLDGRTDFKIDQVIRNLRSHNTLLKNGWVLNTDEGYVPSERGYAQLAEEYLALLPSPDFSKKIEVSADVASDAQDLSATLVRPRMRHR
jgi:hypothetical protein